METKREIYSDKKDKERDDKGWMTGFVGREDVCKQSYVKRGYIDEKRRGYSVADWRRRRVKG